MNVLDRLLGHVAEKLGPPPAPPASDIQADVPGALEFHEENGEVWAHRAIYEFPSWFKPQPFFGPWQAVLRDNGRWACMRRTGSSWVGFTGGTPDLITWKKKVDPAFLAATLNHPPAATAAATESEP